jgi:DNA polymerase-3 subunit epsilon
VEIAVLRVEPDGSSQARARRIDPGVPIPPEATAVHGITDQDVRGEPTFAGLAKSLAALLEGCDFAGFGVARFDLRLLEAEFHRAEVPFSLEGRSVVDALRIFHDRERRDLAAACRLYLGREHEGHHGAEADARAALEVLEGQLARYPDLPGEVETLSESYGLPRRDPSWIDADGKLVWQEGEAAVSFGKHRGRSLRELVAEEPDYLDWILQKDFSDEVKSIVGEAKAGRFPVRG